MMVVGLYSVTPGMISVFWRTRLPLVGVLLLANFVRTCEGWATKQGGCFRPLAWSNALALLVADYLSLGCDAISLPLTSEYKRPYRTAGEIHPFGSPKHAVSSSGSRRNWFQP